MCGPPAKAFARCWCGSGRHDRAGAGKAAASWLRYESFPNSGARIETPNRRALIVRTLPNFMEAAILR